MIVWSALGYFRKKWYLQCSRSGNEMLISGWHSLDWMKEKKNKQNKQNFLHPSWKRGCFLAVPCHGINFREEGRDGGGVLYEDTSGVSWAHQHCAVCIGLRAQHTNKGDSLILAKLFLNWFIYTAKTFFFSLLFYFSPVCIQGSCRLKPIVAINAKVL